MAIAQNIVEIAVRAAEGGRAQRITRINLVAGELRGIVPTQLTFCFGVAAQGTMADGAYLSLETAPVQGRCRGCDEVFTVEDFVYICPRCQGRDIEITGGTELRVKDIEVQ
ncbi:MAG: hydrogenase maturation nickel metallochaperone HypA [Dehalococcoidia bacterium]